MSEEKVGEVDHFFTDISVGIVDLEDSLSVGESVHFKGSTTDFTQEVKSMQIDREDVEEAGRGDVVGMKVKNRVREGDEVFRVE